MKNKQRDRLKGYNVDAAITIQKWVRGYLQRKEFGNFRNNIKKIRKLRRFLSVGYKKIRTRYLKKVLQSLNQAGRVVRDKQDAIMFKYKNYCATMIQKVWKGYIVRKYVIPDILEDLEAQHRAFAVLKGWQIRKIVSCGEVAMIIRKIQEITNYQRRIMNDPTQINNMAMLAHNRK